MKTKAVFSTATQTHSRNKEKQLHPLSLDQAKPLLIFCEWQDSLSLSWCNPMYQISREEKTESLCLESQSPLNLTCYIQNKRVFWPFYSTHLLQNQFCFKLWSWNISCTALSRPRVHPLLSQCSLHSTHTCQGHGGSTTQSTAEKECSSLENKSLWFIKS